MRNILFLYNQKSGRQEPKRILDPAVAVFENAGVTVTARNIDFDGNPLEDIGNTDCIVVAGGDGTIGFVADKMFHHGIDLPIGIIPAGTANDFASMLNIPHNPREAALHIINSPIRRVDCGCANGQYFVNVFSFGALTTTSQHTPDKQKRQLGRLAYIIEGARELYSVRGLPLSIECDGKTTNIEVITALVLNGRTAGRIPLARTAQQGDGILDGVFFVKRTLLRFIWDALLHLCGAKLPTVKHISGRHFRISSTATNITTDVDGQRGPDFPLDIECKMQALRIKG